MAALKPGYQTATCHVSHVAVSHFTVQRKKDQKASVTVSDSNIATETVPHDPH